MRISGFTSVRPDQSGTRTYESFMQFLGDKPARLGIVSTLYDQYSATHLTEALMNTVTRTQKKVSFDSKNSFMVEWDIAIKKIKRLSVLAVDGDGENKSDITFVFGENYYQKHDVFVVEKTRQQFIVVNRPQRIADSKWVVIAKIQDSDYAAKATVEAGDSTRFLTNFQPEMHEEGLTRLVMAVSQYLS